MLSQFSADNKPTLGNLFNFSKDIYPVGRLDADSEGLLILTNDPKLNNRLLNPNFFHQRTYLVQVDGSITENAIQSLTKGVFISVNGKPYRTRPAKVRKLAVNPTIPDRIPPIRYRKFLPTTWIEISLNEGKNRQVRKMTAAVGFPTLRLLRIKIENISIENIAPGEVKEISKEILYDLLNINEI